MKHDTYNQLLSFLAVLERQSIGYTLTRQRDDALMVSLAVPGERWEIEFVCDGGVEVERFVSNGMIAGVEALDELLARYREPESAESPRDDLQPLAELALA